MLSKKIIWKLNIIDLLLLLIILFSVVALVYKSTWGKNNDEYKSFEVTFVCDSAPIELTENIKIGALCADEDYNTDFGVLNSADVSAIPEPLPLEDKSIIENDEDFDEQERSTPTPVPTVPPERAKIVFVVEVEGVTAEHGIRVEKNSYLIGKTVNLVIGDTVFKTYIRDIK